MLNMPMIYIYIHLSQGKNARMEEKKKRALLATLARI